MLTDKDRERVAEKLPVWAQDIIYTLDRQLAERDRQIAELSVGPEDSNVMIRDHVYPDRLLGRNETVDFLLPEGFVQVVHDKNDEDALEVRVVGRGVKGSLAIQPQTGNSIKLRLARY